MRVVARTAALALALALLPTGSASAAFLTPEYDSTITGTDPHLIDEATAVAVDEETHAIYVADRGNGSVLKFDAAGNFLLEFGDFDNPTAIAVDNSDGPEAGKVYVAEGTSTGGDGTIARFDSGGQPDPGWGTGGTIKVIALQKIGVSPFDGTLWALDAETVGSPGGIAGAQISAYDADGTRRFRHEQVRDGGTDGSLAIDSGERIWFSDHNFAALIEVPKNFTAEAGPVLGSAYPGQAHEFAVNPANSDVLITFNEEEVIVFEQPCEPSKGFCAPKESFGNGHLPQPRGLAIDGGTNAVYVAIEGGVAVFHSKVVPDVVPKPASVGTTDAVLSAHLDPLGAGDITGCEIEYGPDSSYGSTASCDQLLPMSDPGDVTVHLTGLSTESVYHYRFLASNGNGTSKGSDRVFTPHWVKGLETGEATDVGPGGATLHGELNPGGETTRYYFEWGETKQYGHKTPAPPGSETSAGGLTQVAATVDGLLTASTTYHYRLVGVNSLGTSFGADREFTTPLALPPQIRNVSATPTGLSTASLFAEISPGFGDTAYRFQYGPDASYGRSTVITGPIGNDGTFHPVSVDVTGLSPGTTYHYRVIAFNFSQYVTSGDATFTTPSPPKVGASSAAVVDPHTAILSARIDSTTPGTSVHFDYGPGASYGSTTAEVGVGPDGTASVSVANLTPGTSYHFRAAVSNQFGQAFGEDGVFQTPPVAERRQRKCAKGKVRRKGKCVKKHRRHKKHKAAGGHRR